MFPESQQGRMSWSGEVTNYIWELSGQSIWYFRLSGMMMLFLGGLTLGASAFVYAETRGIVDDDRSFLVLFLAAALGSCLFFYRGFYVPSPGYNWLAMIGLMLVQAGFLWVLNDRNRFLGVSLLAIGGLIAFLGKPTSGVAILLFLLLSLFVLENRYGNIT